MSLVVSATYESNHGFRRFRRCQNACTRDGRCRYGGSSSTAKAFSNRYVIAITLFLAAFVIPITSQDGLAPVSFMQHCNGAVAFAIREDWGMSDRLQVVERQRKGT